MDDYTKLMKRAKAWMSNHDNPNIAIYHTKNTCEIVRDLTAANSDKSQLLASFRKDNEKLQAKIDELEAELATVRKDRHRSAVAMQKRIEKLEASQIALEIIAPKLSTANAALTSIQKNSCCKPCREAGLVARQALDRIIRGAALKENDDV